jgi:hypothetical protein
MHSSNDKVETLKIGTQYNKSIYFLDTANIASIEEYELLRNLFGRLVEYNEHQQLIPDVSETFYWENDYLVFTFSNKKTSLGDLITAKDAYYSLKRILFLKKSGHGDLRELLCPNHHLNNINDDCPGIKYEDNKLFLKPHSKKLEPYLLSYLESVDFSIIPFKSFDFNSDKIKIINYINTTGPFYLIEDHPEGEWKWASNKNNNKFDLNMPQTIKFISSSIQKAYDDLNNQKIDLIPTYLSSMWNGTAENILNNKQMFNSYFSLPLKVLMVCFTPESLKNFTKEQRFYAAKIVAEEFRPKITMSQSKDTVEFFQFLSDGSLDKNQVEEIKSKRQSQIIPEFKKPIKFSVSSNAFLDLEKQFAKYKEIEVVDNKVSAYLLPLKDRLDMYIVSSDSAWTENLALLGHNLSNIFHLPNMNTDEWLKNYIQIDDYQTRILKLRELHFSLLNQGVIYPIIVNPYIALANKKWKINFYNYTAGSQFWTIRNEQ